VVSQRRALTTTSVVVLRPYYPGVEGAQMQLFAGQAEKRCMLALAGQRRRLVRMSCWILVLLMKTLRSSFLLPNCQASAKQVDLLTGKMGDFPHVLGNLPP
jgi:hypothetical protein